MSTIGSTTAPQLTVRCQKTASSCRVHNSKLRQATHPFCKRHRSSICTSAKKETTNVKASKRKSGAKDVQLRNTKGFAPVDTSVSIPEAGDKEDSPADDALSLPAVSRDQVISACISVSLTLALLGAGLRYAAAKVAFPVTQDLLQLPDAVSTTDILTVAAVVAVVTASRQLLLQTWPDFREATDKSNKQVLTPLQGLDVLLVSVAPGVSEELLFRGGLLPLIPNVWAGVAISGVVFGLLHNNGGRNLAFSAWASGVGVLYGASLVTSHNLLVPMAAHSLANLASAVLWQNAHAQRTVT